MEFEIRLGVPEMLNFWNNLSSKVNDGLATKEETKLFNKLLKAFRLLKSNPRHPSLNSHEISQLTSRYGIKVFESYLENHTPGAERIFWVYGPTKQSITVIALEPHPNDKSNAYSKIKLSSFHLSINDC